MSIYIEVFNKRIKAILYKGLQEHVTPKTVKKPSAAAPAGCIWQSGATITKHCHLPVARREQLHRLSKTERSMLRIAALCFDTRHETQRMNMLIEAVTLLWRQRSCGWMPRSLRMHRHASARSWTCKHTQTCFFPTVKGGNGHHFSNSLEFLCDTGRVCSLEICCADVEIGPSGPPAKTFGSTIGEGGRVFIFL